jgi:ubiquinol-cytochrome c reductase cytochrome b/c1 subunit
MMATGLHGLRAALGPDELLGRHRHHQPVLAIPGVGDSIVTWLWGGFAVGNPTLNRFFSLHYLLPFVIAGVVVLHIWALHVRATEQSDRRRAEDGKGHRAVHALRDHQGRVRRLLCS